ncbi:bifunctional folylpolyglutamate synthase/dihydrofolate synthase [Virgibacillus halophilus]|uniref:tetrahydrofolate synthase n=1 Tax=Tigheibacillus halophilus TaxID=361280 RepID=A0ABU5CED2_9BACI|nr:folylpolyglutamate synthase/dihydrofolate synthase family protein [Virgibacillus halophilus]
MIETYKDAENFLRERGQLGIKPGLQRVSRLLMELGHPERKVSGIHIAGTNGKGSTVQFLKSAFKNNDYLVGSFTSPSMHGLRGHIKLQDDPISKETFIGLLQDMLPVIEKMDIEDMAPTSFEILTVLAFLCFADNVDIALIEAGMGGREDTTNCFTPILSIITNVALDHTAFLGDTVAKIAAHKAGIIKYKVPVVAGELPETAMEVIETEASSKHAALYCLHQYFCYKRILPEKGIHRFLFESAGFKKEVQLRMAGEHQEKNAALAIMATLLLRDMHFPVDMRKALSGISSSTAAGRFEKVYNHPEIIVDSAHNPAGMKAFLRTVAENYPYQRKKLLFAGFKDKDLRHMLQDCFGKFDEITLTSFDHPRAAGVANLEEIFPSETFYKEKDYRVYIERILQDRDPKTIYFIAGSFHFISEVREYMAQNL